jgi:uncharacterized membrane protein YozB (DUF420 family)
MKKINIEVVKNTIAVVIAFSALIILAAAILLGGINKEQEENTVLESGNIENAIKTNQY